MACDRTLLTQAYVDGELDSGAALEVEKHLPTCAECQALAAETGALTDSLRALPRRRAAPPGLEARILRALDDLEGRPTVTDGWVERLRRFVAARRQWLAGVASGLAVAAAVAAAVLISLPSSENDRVIEELASAHVRSLMAQHLLDIGSSDAHTVAPWFKGRVDVAPPVADLSAQGYELLGGRAEYIDGKRVAAIVYGRDAHYVNLFVWSDYDGDHPKGFVARDGYNLKMWSAHGLVFCAVSDDDSAHLQSLAKQINLVVGTDKN